MTPWPLTARFVAQGVLICGRCRKKRRSVVPRTWGGRGRSAGSSLLDRWLGLCCHDRATSVAPDVSPQIHMKAGVDRHASSRTDQPNPRLEREVGWHCPYAKSASFLIRERARGSLPHRTELHRPLVTECLYG